LDIKPLFYKKKKNYFIFVFLFKPPFLKKNDFIFFLPNKNTTNKKTKKKNQSYFSFNNILIETTSKMKKNNNNSRKISNAINLEKIIGNTTTNNSSIACNPISSELAYPAGCIVVLYDPVTNKQTFLSSKRQQTINALCFTPDGKYLAVGEKGKDAKIIIWDMTTKNIAIELSNAHKHGIATLSFSKSNGNRFLMSCGLQHDGIASLWDWRNNRLINKFKIFKNNTKENQKDSPTEESIYPRMWCVDWMESSDEQFVISGMNFVSFYKINQECKLEVHNCNLGQFKDESFIEIAYGKDITHAVTSQGKICTINNTKKSIEKWVDFKVKIGAFSLAENYLVVGGDDGWIRLFEPKTLQYLSTFPRSHALGFENEQPKVTSNVKLVFPNVSCCMLNSDKSKVFAFYSDKSFYVWDIM
jgi:mitogen-activated protein kinase binding protein 1